jgi:hypothetical protein
MWEDASREGNALVPSRAPSRGLCPTRFPNAPSDFLYRDVDLMIIFLVLRSEDTVIYNMFS